jgi:hypothetical protein
MIASPDLPQARLITWRPRGATGIPRCPAFKGVSLDLFCTGQSEGGQEEPTPTSHSLAPSSMALSIAVAFECEGS